VDRPSDTEQPPDITFEHLAVLATIRGDAAAAERLRFAAALSRQWQLAADADIAAHLDDRDLVPELRPLFESVLTSRGWVLVESETTELPVDLRWLIDSGAVSIPELGVLYSRLEIISMADIAAAAERGILEANGVSTEHARAVTEALRTHKRPTAAIPLGRAVKLAEPLIALLINQPGVEWVKPVGSLRRGEEMLRDVELLVASASRVNLDSLASLPETAHVSHRSTGRLHMVMSGAPIAIRVATPPQASQSLLFLTGSTGHLERLKTLAASLGLRLTPDGLERDGTSIAAREEEVYRELDLPFIAPELRNGDDEVEFGRQGRLPRIIEQDDLRGDLHMHTSWSDGRDSVEEMAGACAELGYEYIAITDHSQSSGATRNLSIADVQTQADEIAAVRRKFPRLMILHSCEVDILADGSLDFDDRVLRRFDIVLASLHERAGHSPTELLHRYLSAMTHPYVSIITHPANRLFPRRPGYELDFPKLFEAAVKTRTALEIDGAPTHLDLNAALARRAAAAGVMLTVDSDAHRTDALDAHARLGLLLARKAWVEPRHVLNTRRWTHVKGWIASKRRRFA
jgi:DNA polymerase (family X)